MNQLPNNKYIYTNGTYSHAHIILNKMNLYNKNKLLFEKIYARDTLPYMKPYKESYDFVERDILYSNNLINKIHFFDDLKENLLSAKKKGWITIWIHPNYYQKENYIDYSFDTLHKALIYFNKLYIVK